jgi:hypothetical protein|tara:strand:+ start:299 stop:514 length:216 start_codon:yes stop_codon:yes gene_type:complete
MPNKIEHPNHYNKGKIEVWDFIADQNLNFFEGNIVKYITRWHDKNGLEDLLKVKEYIDKYIEVIKKDDELQ